MGADWHGNSNPSLDARIEGTEVFTVPAGEKKDFVVTFDFDCDFSGIEVYAWNSNIGDNIDLRTEYYVGEPLNTWRRYKKFGKHFNVYPNNVTRVILFPTKPKAGVRMVVTYDNKGTEEVKFSLNKFQFVEMKTLDFTVAEEGEDW